MLEAWVDAADSLGLPRSMGKLYGLLFMSSKPLSAKDCAQFLHISRSSAGEGLKTLRELGAVKLAFELGERSERFVIEPDLGVLIRSILGGRILPTLQTLSETLSQESETSEVARFGRLQKLSKWVKKIEGLKAGLEEGSK